jgi:hypothetical protein
MTMWCRDTVTPASVRYGANSFQCPFGDVNLGTSADTMLIANLTASDVEQAGRLDRVGPRLPKWRQGASPLPEVPAVIR